MLVSIIGPNLRDQSKGNFHVHATGCADVRRDPNYRNQEIWDIEVTSKIEVAFKTYSDMITEDDSAEDYLHDFHFAPCCSKLPKN